MIKELVEEHFFKALVVLAIMGFILGFVGIYAVNFLMALFNIFNVMGSAFGGGGG